MPQYWSSLVNPNAPWQTSTGTTLNTATTATISPEGAGGTGDDPQILTWWQGLSIRVIGRGFYSNGSTATNATFSLYTSLSGVALSAGVALATTGAMALPVSVAGLSWKVEAIVQCRAIAQGAGTATLYTDGEIIIQTATAAGTAGNVQHWPMPATGGANPANVDTMIAHTFGLVCTLSQVTGGPSITCTQILHELVSG